MIFKLAWQLLKSVRILIPIVLIGITLFVFMQSSALGQVFSLFIKNQEQASGILGTIQQFIPVSTPAAESPTPTPWPSSIKMRTKNTQTEAVFTVEIADTEEKRQTGYMYRPTIGEYNGMLFIFPQPVNYPFWMKNVEFPLDIIFLSKELKVQDIKSNVPPCKQVDATQKNCPFYGPESTYQYVLEIKGGNAGKLGIIPGTEFSIE